MVFGIVLFSFLFVLAILYFLLFKEYAHMMNNFELLVKVVETRNLVLMRILPEIKNKGLKKEITKMVDDMMVAKRENNDKFIQLDVDINKKLDSVYSELNKSKNPLVIEELKKAVNFEKKLKTIRREYNKVVEVYNAKICKHPKLMAKFLKMRPYNTYNIKENNVEE